MNRGRRARFGAAGRPVVVPANYDTLAGAVVSSPTRSIWYYARARQLKKGQNGHDCQETVIIADVSDVHTRSHPLLTLVTHPLSSRSHPLASPQAERDAHTAHRGERACRDHSR